MSRSTGDSLEALIIEFVVWLTSKTEQSRILWRRQADVLTASIEDVVVQFATSRPTAGSETWQVFTVGTAAGEEIFRVIAICASIEKPPLARPLNALFRTARGFSRAN
jgi:hypothetical protein